MKKLLWVVLLAGCSFKYEASETPTVKTTTMTDTHYQVDLLFEKDGCKVYRFNDKYNWRYYTDCKGPQVSAQYSKSCGKNCTETVTEEVIQGASQYSKSCGTDCSRAVEADRILNHPAD